MKLKLLVAAIFASASFATHASAIPQVCQDYFSAVEEFAAKHPQVADVYKQSIESTRQQLNSVPGDKSMLAPGCQSAFDAFKQSTASM
ncbi:MAG: DUF5339 family protein [Alcaligenaceae bacterium]|nr:DUF5339 family protein [Alcaligenaceae bacterium]